MAQNDTKYCGKARRKTGRYGEFFSVSFSPADIELMLANRSESGWLNLVMNELKTPDRRGNTHTLAIDDWRPDGGRSGSCQRQSESRPPAHPAADPDYGPPSSGRDNGGFDQPPPPPDLPPVDDDIPF